MHEFEDIYLRETKNSRNKDEMMKKFGRKVTCSQMEIQLDDGLHTLNVEILER
jgi:hypothetical protein